MYYYEKDYIMRLIHGIARVLARLLFGREYEDAGELAPLMAEEAKRHNDYLRNMIDLGQINAAENRLFDLLRNTAWEDRQKAALILSFYDYVNSKEDSFLDRADFSREEIISGMRDAMAELEGTLESFLPDF